MLKDFKSFILRGNVVDLAVAVVIGAAFNSVIQSFVKDFITPLITGILKKGSLQGDLVIAHKFTLHYGDFLSVLISFVIDAFVIFIFVVQPINKLTAYSNRHKSAEPGTKDCPECLSSVPLQATRCAYCAIKL